MNTTAMPSTRLAAVVCTALGAAVIAFLFWLIYFRPGAGGASGLIAWLPLVNATFNTISATLIVLGILSIRRGARLAHGICMSAAVVSSALFLISYIIYHSFHGDTRFLGQGLIRPAYFFILISHIVLSAVMVPMILLTLFLAAARRWPTHRALAKWTYPIWLYVSVTGVVIFILLKIYPTA